MSSAFTFSYAFNVAFLIGRILIGLFFLMAGFNHFARLNMMAAYAKMKHVPAPSVGVAGGGVLMILGGLSMLLGFHPTIGVILLLIFLLPTTFMMHNFWAVQDPQAKLTEMIMFQKNFAIMGLLLMTLMIPRPWPISLGR